MSALHDRVDRPLLAPPLLAARFRYACPVPPIHSLPIMELLVALKADVWEATIREWRPRIAMEPSEHEDERYSAVRQYSLAEIIGVWAAAAVPMGVLAWVVAPWLRDQLGGRDPFIEALLICFNMGLVYQLVLVLILVWREQGSLEWSRVRDALWLRAPKDPKTRRVGGKVWWWVLPFLLLSAAIEALPIYPTGPSPRDLPNLLGSDRAEHFFSGAWGWFALLVSVAVLAPVVRNCCSGGCCCRECELPSAGAIGRSTALLFGVYHLHQPWSIPSSVLDGMFGQAYPTKRFQSVWMAIITHTAPSFVIIGVVLSLVL